MPKILDIAETLLLERVVTQGWPLSHKSKLGLVLIAFSGLLAVIACGFLIVAFYLWVQAQFPANEAALISAGAIFLVALMTMGGGYAALRNKRLRAHALKKDIKDNISVAIATLDDELGEQIRENPVTAVALASLAGFVIGEKTL